LSSADSFFKKFDAAFTFPVDHRRGRVFTVLVWISFGKSVPVNYNAEGGAVTVPV
jgi:hypothetical protein